MSYTKNKYSDFEKKIKNKYPEENLEIILYTGAKEKGIIKCLECGSIYELKNASNFLYKNKKRICSKCVSREDTRNMKKKIEKIFDNNYNIQLLNTYVKITNDLEIKCLKCGGVFRRKPYVLTQTQKCPICETYSTLKTETFFKKELEDKLNGEYELLGEYKGTNTPALFKHTDCGFIFKNTPHQILQKTPCPKCKKFNSKGEIKIKKFLEAKGILFIPQKHFKNLKKLSFDFYLPDYNLLIEYQGEQHFHPIKYFGGNNKYLKQIENDNIKRKFCKKNNLSLLEIGYTEYNQIDRILLKWFNDYSPQSEVMTSTFRGDEIV